MAPSRQTRGPRLEQGIVQRASPASVDHVGGSGSDPSLLQVLGESWFGLQGWSLHLNHYRGCHADLHVPQRKSHLTAPSSLGEAARTQGSCFAHLFLGKENFFHGDEGEEKQPSETQRSLVQINGFR